MIAIDSNLLIYAHRSAVPEHRAARRALERASLDRRGWGFTLANVAEFWCVVTHPAAAGRPSTPAEARGFLAGLREGGARFWSPTAGQTDRLLALAEELEVSGARIFDLQIALTAFENGASEIWTHDRSFRTLPGLAVSDPLDAGSGR